MNPLTQWIFGIAGALITAALSGLTISHIRQGNAIERLKAQVEHEINRNDTTEKHHDEAMKNFSDLNQKLERVLTILQK